MCDASHYEYKCAVEEEHDITNNEIRIFFLKTFSANIVVQAQTKSISPLNNYIENISPSKTLFFIGCDFFPHHV